MKGARAILTVAVLQASCATQTGEQNATLSAGIVTCDPIPVALAANSCSVSKGSGSATIVRGTILAENLIYQRGSVLFGSDGKIVDASCDVSAHPVAADATIVDCADAVVSPGLINPHDHIWYNSKPPSRPTGERYEHRHHWRMGLDGHTIPDFERATLPEQITWSELRHAMSGTTSIAGMGGTPGLVRNLEDNDLQGDLQGAAAFTTVFPLGDVEGVMLAEGCDYPGLVDTAEFSSSRAFQAHVAEGVDAHAANEMQCITGQHENGVSVLSLPAAFVHFVGATTDDAIFMRDNDISMIWSPRSNIALYGQTANVTMLDKLGINIALSTDWLPSGSMNMLRELKCAADYSNTYLEGHFDHQDLWRMATVNAAKSFALDEQIGSLAPGRLADIAIYQNLGTSDPYRSVVDADVGNVLLVLRSGKAMLGREVLVSDLRPDDEACSLLPARHACGNRISVCLDGQDSGYLQAVVAANEDSYALQSCSATPLAEPTCSPEWPDAFDGKLVVGVDSDGDGVSDASDNCPTVFNPIRPLDSGRQSDWDGDATGDACDNNPLE